MRLKKSGGYLLAEILVAILLLSVVASTMVASMVTIPLASNQSGMQSQAALAQSSLLQELKNYVVADPTPAPGAPADSWHLPGDSSCSNCWALAPGNHAGTAFLPAALRNPPYDAIMTYAVTGDCRTSSCKVDMKVDWKLP